MSSLLIFSKKLTLLPLFRNQIEKVSTLVTLDLPQGKIKGEKISLPHKKSYYKFFGIPYAKPPIGNLRFQNPQPLEKFPEQPLDCTKERNSSLQQFNIFSEEITGSEDCLYLNIHAPDIKSETKYPVMVYIHGGFFMFGYGNRDILFPNDLIEENIILITINYRLGVFGFLSLPSGGISGNFGLKDQQLALKWIHDNIYLFNGDPNNITIFGFSSGGASAHFQMLSAESRKYFHKVLCQSGLATMEWTMAQDAEIKAFKLAEILGFKGDAKETANFLQNFKNFNKIVANTYKVLSKEERRYLVRLAFGPVVELENCENAFITKNPIDILINEKLPENIPMLMGYTSKEGIIQLANSFRKVEDIESDLGCLIPNTICEPDDVKCKDIVNNIRKFYFNGRSIKNEDISELCDALGDIHFIVDVHKTAKLYNDYQSQTPLYCYKFSYDGKLNYFKSRYKYEYVKGACHGDELCYLFYPNEIAEKMQPDENDFKMIKKLCKLWSNFAKFGNPTPATEENKSDIIDFTWDPIAKTNNGNFVLDCLDINIKCSMIKNPDEDRVQFWKRLLSDTKRNY